ncbi:MAG: ATP-grasp domain-containing protein [bacterium]|nr:ATP-grasp domain-containing protein [bacterium]
MEFRSQNFIPALLGSDINTYSVARAFHEAYGVKSAVLGKASSGPSHFSKIADFYMEPEIDNEKLFLTIINSFASKHPEKKIILLACGDSYVELIGKHKKGLRDNIIAPYIDEEMMAKLMKKETFYKLCDQYNLPHPATLVHKKSDGLSFNLPFPFPVIVKPSNGVNYWKHHFDGQKKVYKLNDRSELEKVLTEIYLAGYDDSLIIQEFIPGDDSKMRVLTCYSDKNGKVRLSALGHVLLEEHTPKGLGNHAVIINENDSELEEKIRRFLEDMHFVGFSNMDIKYDERDGKFKIFELNVRQGRSNYYVTAGGHNIAEYVAGEYIFGKIPDFTDKAREKLWLVIPFRVAYKHVRDLALRQKMKELSAKGQIINPLFYKGDYSFRRTLYLVRSYLSHFWKYYKYF